MIFQMSKLSNLMMISTFLKEKLNNFKKDFLQYFLRAFKIMIQLLQSSKYYKLLKYSIPDQ